LRCRKNRKAPSRRGFSVSAFGCCWPDFTPPRWPEIAPALTSLIYVKLDDVEGEVVNIRAAGFQTRNEIIDFHLRKLVFLDGPEGVTKKLSQWH
jgi:hypothetical protein